MQIPLAFSLEECHKICGGCERKTDVPQHSIRKFAIPDHASAHLDGLAVHIGIVHNHHRAMMPGARKNSRTYLLTRSKTVFEQVWLFARQSSRKRAGLRRVSPAHRPLSCEHH